MQRKKKVTNNRAAAPATAAGQALGYSLQFTRLTAMLLEAPERSVCSLEVLDDVAIEHEDGQERLIQSKSALGANPVSNRAISLWKTLFNWMTLIEKRLINPDRAIFELYVSRPVSGTIINAFHEASNIEQAKEALKLAKRALSGGDEPAALSEELAKYVDAVLNTDEKVVANLISRLRLVCGSGSPQADLEAIIRGHPVSQSRVRMITDHMCGWVKTRVDERLEKSLPAVIDRDEFHTAYISFCRSVDRDTILRSLARIPTEAEQVERLPDPFVRQLDLIELPFEDKLAAVSDFLRAAWDRAMWAKAGDVDETSFDELDESLTRTWKNVARTTGIEHKTKSSVERGQLLYGSCMVHYTQVQGMEPPSHFIPGCFHQLADGLHLGWHPEYKELMKEAGVPA